MLSLTRSCVQRPHTAGLFRPLAWHPKLNTAPDICSQLSEQCLNERLPSVLVSHKDWLHLGSLSPHAFLCAELPLNHPVNADLQLLTLWQPWYQFCHVDPAAEGFILWL